MPTGFTRYSQRNPSTVSAAAYHKDLVMLAAGVLVMSAIVVVFNRLVWKPLYRLTETRYSLTK